MREYAYSAWLEKEDAEILYSRIIEAPSREEAVRMVHEDEIPEITADLQKLIDIGWVCTSEIEIDEA